MMNDLFSYLTIRTLIIYASTVFSIMILMLVLDIIKIEEVSAILKLSPEATNALKLVFSRIQEVTKNIIDILSQLLNKLFGWAGVEIDLSKIHVDVHQGSEVGTPPNPTNPTPTHVNE